MLIITFIYKQFLLKDIKHIVEGSDEKRMHNFFSSQVLRSRTIFPSLQGLPLTVLINSDLINLWAAR